MSPLKRPVAAEAVPLRGGLKAELDAPFGARSGVDLFWLGQAGFAIRSAELTLLVDPYLSDSLEKKYRGSGLPHERMRPPPIAPGELRGVDVVLCTHRHQDHMDPETLGPLALHNPACRFVVPRAERERARALGLGEERLSGVSAGETWSELPGLSVEALPSAHEELSVDERGEHAFLGYLVTMGGMTVYHSGDCVPYAGLEERLRLRAIDAALLPINGRSPSLRAKGIPGNFTVEEALALCRGAGIALLVGHHVEMFAFNTVERGEATRRLLAACGSVEWILPQIDTRYRLRR